MGVSGEEASNDTVGMSTTAIFSVFAGYCFRNFWDKPALL